MFGINPSEFVVLLVVAAIVLGPERLPQYAQQLARLVRELRRMAQGAQEHVRGELGSEFDDVDWRKLDPRQYDPRRIVREALSDSFDPDDPLGLRDGKDGYAENGHSENGYGDEPQRRNGARSREDLRHSAPTAPAAGEAGGRGATRATSAADDVPFDPDAT